MSKDTVRARYTAGTIGSRQVPSYVDEPGVDPGRNTETYASLTLGINSPRWAGVPFTLRSGKSPEQPRPRSRSTSVRCPRLPDRPVARHRTERAAARTHRAVRTPGDHTQRPRAHAETRELVAQTTPPRFDALRAPDPADVPRDPMLFIRGDEAEEAWRIIDPVMAAWSAGQVPMQEYAAGAAPPGSA